MIRRIEYANGDWTRTAVIVAHDGPNGWCVMFGDRATANASVEYCRTLTQCQALARQWVGVIAKRAATGAARVVRDADTPQKADFRRDVSHRAKHNRRRCSGVLS